ncbi:MULTISPECIES: Rrf2 family transcriptional regulator [Paenibacillus]|uniref:Rrf2 family transcriptional regulator n=1 Tax=Paenibacillus TaxID=44249 RepID=UPI0007BF7D84|nr:MULTISPECIES: Rrf2 family transcriptional regulator [Paenibacillus]MCZ1264713.1 Rrf2 family transcriptional regulator [Paenibacillus tundrae]OAX51104.1 HTH-type transcriptional repressor NsrR [Paenibacillus sp. AD87]SDM10371.1 transcriptional regulator, BadM/Rrf2 family [Paenibacillus sp. OK060]SEB27765.1 transcriptional regulator, BadM/Rrf2 family [Paenibacillus sp. 276b]
MKYSKATNYALHTMLFLVATEPEQLVSVHQLAEMQKVSPTYLSKILTKLVKAGMIESTSGANGGYRLSRKNPDPSFLEIIHAIEGQASLFECSQDHNEGCLIQQVMVRAEEEMESYLNNKKMSELAAQMKAAHSV